MGDQDDTLDEGRERRLATPGAGIRGGLGRKGAAKKAVAAKRGATAKKGAKKRG